MKNLKLVDPTPDLEVSFCEIATEWRKVGENKFNDCFDDFALYVETLLKQKEAKDLLPNSVPGSTFLLIDDSLRIVGTSRLRHWLVPHLEKEGGHIGYDIRPSEQRKGYGTALLYLSLTKARELGLREVTLTYDSDNLGSLQVIEKNGGQLIVSPPTLEGKRIVTKLYYEEVII